MKDVTPSGPICAEIDAPGSKSLTHRALLIASLAEGESILISPLRCEDTEITARACRKIGAQVIWGEGSARVRGVGGRVLGGTRKFFTGNSGTTMRLLTGILGIGRGEYIITGNSRMKERPIGPLLDAMRQMGIDCRSFKGDGFPPVLIRSNGMMGGDVRVDGSLSSQFVSALLIASPYAEKDTRIEVQGGVSSRPYVDLTVETMKEFGAMVKEEPSNVFHVEARRFYRNRDFQIEGDYSLSSYFFGAAAVTGGRIIVKNLREDSKQGDRLFLNILEQMGCHVRRWMDKVEVSGYAKKGIKIDMNRVPDLVQTLAVVASFVPEETVIRGVSHLRFKETDRLRALAKELRRMGVYVEELEDGLKIEGGGHRSGVEISTYRDHRMAMSFAVAGLKVPGLQIKGEGCVKKSFPDFWRKWESLYRKG